MKYGTLTFAAVLTTIALLAIPVPLAAQAKNHTNTQHHHYKFVDLGTFGGPTSFINPPFNVNPELSSQGVTAGGSATPVALTPTNNPFDCGGLDGIVPYVFHAFEWRRGAVLDLGALSPADENCSNASAVSDNCDIVVGASENGIIDPVLGFKELRAVRWQNGRISDLGTLGGAMSSAGSLNHQGQVAGFAANSVPDPFSIYYYFVFLSSNGTQTRAFLWDESNGMQDLGTLGTGNDAAALFLNEPGQVAGFAYTNAAPNPTTGVPTIDPFLWDKTNGMQDLGTLGGTFGEPTALNNRGEVIGFSNLSGDQSTDPFLWRQGRLIDLGTNTLGGRPLTADAINDAGEVVGQSIFQNQSRDAYLWRNGVATDLGHLSGDCGSRAWGINSNSQIVGVSRPCTGIQGRAFLWENGSMVDLNTLVPPGSLKLIFPMAINDRGEITGTADPPGCGDDDGGLCGHAFLAIPCDDNHPEVEGCDYSLVEASDAPASSASLSSGSETPERGGLPLSGPVNPGLHRPGLPFGMMYRDSRAAPPPQTGTDNTHPLVLLEDELRPGARKTPGILLRHHCEVSSSGVYTGQCLGSAPACQKWYANYQCVGSKPPKVEHSSCGNYDPYRLCS
jgi:probable HAF family extracellular repeat protein